MPQAHAQGTTALLGFPRPGRAGITHQRCPLATWQGSSGLGLGEKRLSRGGCTGAACAGGPPALASDAAALGREPARRRASKEGLLALRCFLAGRLRRSARPKARGERCASVARSPHCCEDGLGGLTWRPGRHRSASDTRTSLSLPSPRPASAGGPPSLISRSRRPSPARGASGPGEEPVPAP